LEAETAGSTSYPKWGLEWTYDRYGNRTQQSILSGCQSPMTCPTNSVSVDSTTNRLTGSPYTYDENGNMLHDGLNTLAYDAESRVVRVNSSNPMYVYDGAGLRVKKCDPHCTSPTTTTVYIFSGSKVIAEYVNGAAVNSPTREYVYSGSQLVATHEGTSLKFHHQDHLSRRVTSDGTSGSQTYGQKLTESGHFPYGESWYESGGTLKLKFTSYERDSESGNDFAIFRYYSSRIARFCSADPLAGSIANPQSLNRFAYVMNDPVNHVDPLGLSCREVCVSIEGGEPRCTKECTPDPVDVGDSPLSDFEFPQSGLVFPDLAPQDPPFPPLPDWINTLPQTPPPPPPPCQVSPSSLNNYLQSKNSPLAGEGSTLFDAGRRHDVDPRLIVAIAGAETGFGRNITRGQFNAWNWFYGGPSQRNHPFNSWAQGINSVTRGIGGPNYLRGGRTNTASIYARYCVGPDCVNGLRNINAFLRQQGGDPSALNFPCP
jgi:RHS repeat-associated protein